MSRVVLKTVSTVEAVSNMIEDDIYSLRYRMGEKIVEMDLVARYNVSRNTLRESIAYLISKGLLEKVANKGIYVKEILSEDIEDIFHLRELLEAEAIRRIIAGGNVPKNLYTLEKNASRFEQEIDHVAIIEADIAFHMALVSAAESPRLMNMYENLLFEVKLCMFQARAFVPLRPINAIHHHNILLAMENGNISEALSQLSEHIDSAIATYKTGLPKRHSGTLHGCETKT